MPELGGLDIKAASSAWLMAVWSPLPVSFPQP
jgi:hypothetical protein